MDIVEEVVRRRQTLALDRPQEAYSEIRDLLERRMSFDEVTEEKYFHDVEEGTIRSRIETLEVFDAHTVEEIEIYLLISERQREMDIQVKAKLITHYDTDTPWKNKIWFYAYRALYDKFFYGKVRHEFEEDVEEGVDELMHRLREALEVQN